jgi:predicted transcriptional regulator
MSSREESAVNPTSSKPKRTAQEAMHYALGARVRTEILTILHDGPASHSELAKLTGIGVGKIGHHIQELVESGSIELAGIEQVRNQNVHVYRAVDRAYIDNETARHASPEENNEVAAFILQAITAEAMSSLWAGKLDAGSYRVILSWDVLNVDDQGQEEVDKEQHDSAERIMNIGAEAANRLAESGEPGKPMVVATLGFERSRARREPYPLQVKAD